MEEMNCTRILLHFLKLSMYLVLLLLVMHLISAAIQSRDFDEKEIPVTFMYLLCT